MKINNELVSMIMFTLSLMAVVGLQFAPHVSQALMDALFSVMGLSAGHALGHSSANGTVANIHIPSAPTDTGAKS